MFAVPAEQVLLGPVTLGCGITPIPGTSRALGQLCLPQPRLDEVGLALHDASRLLHLCVLARHFVVP